MLTSYIRLTSSKAEFHIHTPINPRFLISAIELNMPAIIIKPEWARMGQIPLFY